MAGGMEADSSTSKEILTQLLVIILVFRSHFLPILQFIKLFDSSDQNQIKVYHSRLCSVYKFFRYPGHIKLPPCLMVEQFSKGASQAVMNPRANAADRRDVS